MSESEEATSEAGDRSQAGDGPADTNVATGSPLAISGRPAHPALASIAIGCWVASLGFDAVSSVSTTAWAYARGAWLLTGFGVAAGLVAAFVGALDLRSLDRSSAAARLGRRHLAAMDLAIVVFAASFIVRGWSSFAFHDTASRPALAISITGLVLLCVGVWLGSSLTYREGVGVRPPQGDTGVTQVQAPDRSHPKGSHSHLKDEAEPGDRRRADQAHP